MDKLWQHHIETNDTVSLNGLVLCGGQSTRMGRDKGEIFYYHKSQRQHLFEMLQPFCTAVFLSCNEEQSKLVKDIPLLKDAYINIGPLAGVLTAFEYNQHVAWLAVACDLPFIHQEAIAYLLAHRNAKKTATAFIYPENNLPEPLFTIWEPKAFPLLLTQMQQGIYSPRKALMNCDVELIPVPDATMLKNINTQEEYQQAISLLRHTK